MKLLTILLFIVAVAFASTSVVSNVAVHNGNCNYNNGYITENGVSRPATREEDRLIEEYQREMKIWAESLSASITDEVDRVVKNALSSKSDRQPRVEGNKRPQAPKAPCLCSSATCENNNVNIIRSDHSYSSHSNNRQTQYNNRNTQLTQDKSGQYWTPARPYDNAERQTGRGQPSRAYNPASGTQQLVRNQNTQGFETSQDRTYGSPRAYDSPSQRTGAYSNAPAFRQDQRYTQKSDIQHSEGRNNVNIIDYGIPAQNQGNQYNTQRYDTRQGGQQQAQGTDNYNREQNGYVARRVDGSDAYGRQDRRNGNANIQRSEGSNNVNSISK